MASNTEQVKELRDKTGVSIMQCKAALEETGGDMEAAMVILRKKAGAIAEKKASRSLGAGAVASYVHDNSVASLVLLSCETDFVAKNEEFVALAKDIAMQVTATSPKYVSMEQVPEEEVESAKKAFEGELEGKPEDMKEKIMEGKINSYFKDMVLNEQSYIKDESKKIIDLIKEATQKFGERIEVSDIARISVRG